MCQDGAMRFDLHTHSTYSDGTTSPTEIAESAAEIKLAGFALTDHDTTDGWDEARAAAATHNVDFLPGIELTTSHEGRSVHLLAYGIDVDDDPLQDRLKFLRDSRKFRAQEMVRRLQADFVYDWDSLLGQVERGEILSIGRPHLADALVAGGYFRDRSHAFSEALSPRGPYYLPTATLDTVEAIHLVEQAGGVSVLAHPAAFRMRAPLTPHTISTLARAGLGGVEIWHPENRSDWITPIREHAEQEGLFLTGASDFHGAGKPNTLAEHTSPLEIVQLIRRRVHTPR